MSQSLWSDETENKIKIHIEITSEDLIFLMCEELFIPDLFCHGTSENRTNHSFTDKPMNRRRDWDGKPIRKFVTGSGDMWYTIAIDLDLELGKMWVPASEDTRPVWTRQLGEALYWIKWKKYCCNSLRMTTSFYLEAEYDGATYSEISPVELSFGVWQECLYSKFLWGFEQILYSQVCARPHTLHRCL